jgi:hypothetical protein
MNFKNAIGKNQIIEFLMKRSLIRRSGGRKQGFNQSIQHATFPSANFAFPDFSIFLFPLDLHGICTALPFVAPLAH